MHSDGAGLHLDLHADQMHLKHLFASASPWP